ncbi:MAG: bifunctional pyr operon transcriptional regulator/uracil phosphoribosyltransferase PyrR [Clostridia bacterium]|nr:bifunctional pyr operon transcriptional regulator/uracil phosphoribosyltransferase PyrR [Clostridia bacterium]
MQQNDRREKAVIMDEAAIGRSVTRISHEILERNKGVDRVAVVGIQRRGADLARRICDRVEAIEGVRPLFGTLDITFYRDDLSRRSPQPTLSGTDLPFSPDGLHVVLVDDVIYTGRTARAAIDALFDKGRPDSVQLAVLIDRGLRELPIRPDYVGKNVPTRHSEQISVRLAERDGEEKVSILE